jgi:hypothetical protein
MVFYTSFVADFSPGSAGGSEAVTESRESSDPVSLRRDPAGTIREQYGLVRRRALIFLARAACRVAIRAFSKRRASLCVYSLLSAN